MRNYQVKKDNPYYLPHDLYMQALYMIRGYKNLRQRKVDIIYGSSPPPDGMPKGRHVSNPTERKAIVLEMISLQLQAIEQTISELRGKYSRTCTGEVFDPYEAFMDYGVFCYYRSKPNRDECPARRTWTRYRSEFAYKVLKKINFI